MMTTTTREKPKKTRASVFRVGLLLAPFLAVVLGGRWVALAYADAVANVLATVASAMDDVRIVTQSTSKEPDPALGTLPLPEQAPLALDDSDREGAPPPPASGNANSRTRETLLVPASRLLRITAKQLGHIDATPAVDSGSRRVGLSLSGVQGLGLGLVDGDVVASINGLPTATKDAAIAAAIGVWKSGKRWAHALVFRRGKPISVSVEVPASAQ